MATVATDDFNRADGGLGANWATQTGYTAPAIVSNAIPSLALTDYAAVYTAADAGSDDMYTQITSVVTTSDKHNDTIIWTRCVNTGAETGYVGDAPSYAPDPGLLWTLQVATAGSFTLLAQGTGAFLGTGTRTLLLQAVGTTITLKQDGTTLSSVTDSTHSGSTKRYGAIHIYSDNTNYTKIDNFEMGNFRKAPPPRTNRIRTPLLQRRAT